jgi:hypothetical protein
MVQFKSFCECSFRSSLCDFSNLLSTNFTWDFDLWCKTFCSKPSSFTPNLTMLIPYYCDTRLDCEFKLKAKWKSWYACFHGPCAKKSGKRSPHLKSIECILSLFVLFRVPKLFGLLTVTKISVEYSFHSSWRRSEVVVGHKMKGRPVVLAFFFFFWKAVSWLLNPLGSKSQ